MGLAKRDYVEHLERAEERRSERLEKQVRTLLEQLDEARRRAVEAVKTAETLCQGRRVVVWSEAGAGWCAGTVIDTEGERVYAVLDDGHNDWPCSRVWVHRDEVAVLPVGAP